MEKVFGSTYNDMDNVYDLDVVCSFADM